MKRIVKMKLKGKINQVSSLHIQDISMWISIYLGWEKVSQILKWQQGIDEKSRVCCKLEKKSFFKTQKSCQNKKKINTRNILRKEFQTIKINMYKSFKTMILRNNKTKNIKTSNKQVFDIFEIGSWSFRMLEIGVVEEDREIMEQLN